jgi:hypothetical protein
MIEPTPDELAGWALEVNNAGVPGVGSKTITYSDALAITQGAHDAWRQLILEVFILKTAASMTAEEWFNDDGPRKPWAQQIRMAYTEWQRLKAKA